MHIISYFKFIHSVPPVGHATRWYHERFYHVCYGSWRGDEYICEVSTRDNLVRIDRTVLDESPAQGNCLYLNSCFFKMVFCTFSGNDRNHIGCSTQNSSRGHLQLIVGLMRYVLVRRPRDEHARQFGPKVCSPSDSLLTTSKVLNMTFN